MPKRVLTVAESDTTGSAGIQADIKTVLALGGYATTAVTRVMIQSRREILWSCPMEPNMVAEQMRTVLEDIGADAIKVGALDTEAVVNAVGDVLDECQGRGIPVVIDPSIVARDGTVLADDHAVAALKRRLFIRTAVLTPNLREAEIMTGMAIRDVEAMRHAADMMRTLGVETVVLKAGPVTSDKVLYFIATGDDREMIFERPMLATEHTLGAGSTLASAIAVSLAQGMAIDIAIERGLDYMHHAMLYAPDFGAGAGPINHAFDIEKNSKYFRSDTIKVHRI